MLQYDGFLTDFTFCFVEVQDHPSDFRSLDSVTEEHASVPFNLEMAISLFKTAKRATERLCEEENHSESNDDNSDEWALLESAVGELLRHIRARTGSQQAENENICRGCNNDTVLPYCSRCLGI